MADLLTSMKSASKRFVDTVQDAGAKTMLKTDIAFLERDIKSKKQEFGIEVYDIINQSKANSTPDSETMKQVLESYEKYQSQINEFESKVNSEKDEMEGQQQNTASSS